MRKAIVRTSMLMVVLTSCLISKKVTVDNFYTYETPANGIKISDNLFCDQTEIDNSSWLEYMFWNKKIFGATSYEYRSTLPDTSVWLTMDKCLHAHAKNYLRHFVYRNFPVVGVSQQQAEAYSKWRSDRVFEYLLVQYKVIEYDTYQTKENYFTTEKYYKGESKNVISDIKVAYYPEFRLPTLSERQLILTYSDSLDKKCNSKKCVYCSKNYPKIWCDVTPCEKEIFKIEPTRRVNENCPSVKSIYNLRGNVSEWTTDENIVVGGSWTDRIEDIARKDTFDVSRGISTGFGGTKREYKILPIYPFGITNAWTGFRNVCEWKKWEE